MGIPTKKKDTSNIQSSTNDSKGKNLDEVRMFKNLAYSRYIQYQLDTGYSATKYRSPFHFTLSFSHEKKVLIQSNLNPDLPCFLRLRPVAVIPQVYRGVKVIFSAV
ncbi:hypothetical protein PVK06_007480 [Gossypium arboreum]|uniref:Uncharacterized protein n=1 Tax=Gossypium arboreum TaxID=29729 RepID=A0ABR0QIF1_GOSAR|nr:hypothetical protein PVK06_007480 [Gossypium arboreum]